MTVRRDDSVPVRSVEVEIGVPGTPEEVWQAIATGNGWSAWFAPTEIEEREGGAIKQSMGPGMESAAVVTAWQPPHSFAIEEQYYLVWPLLILGLLAAQRRWFLPRPASGRHGSPSIGQQRAVVVCGLLVLAIASLAWSVWSTAHDQAFAYLSTFTRASVRTDAPASARSFDRRSWPSRR